MSELNETFKRAILTFTHADEFAISLYEGAYTIADVNRMVLQELTNKAYNKSHRSGAL